MADEPTSIQMKIPVLSILEDCHRHLGNGATTGQSGPDAGVKIRRVNQTESRTWDGDFEMAVAVVPQVQYWPAVPKVRSSKLTWSFFTLLSSSFELEE